jgi:hypothetical protein
MKTIAQHIQDGISTLDDLKDALQTAMQLEFSTIPPYLCAQWSIDLDSDPSDVADTIQGIAVQEMHHFALAGNMLTAIGGTPNIANAAFIPSYPTNVLPGGIPQTLAVDLQPLSSEQLEVFMQIEYPEFPPVALAAETPPATIGAFYDTISDGFATVNPTINPTALYVSVFGVPGDGQITTVADAQAAIQRIKIEGEGTEGSPDEPPGDSDTFAHYYTYKEIYVGKTLVQVDGTWSFTGAAIQMPTVYSFKQSTTSPDPSIPFNQALQALMTELQTCWTTAGATPSISAMQTLQGLGTGLIQQGIRPEFLWPDQSVIGVEGKKMPGLGYGSNTPQDN